MNEKEEFIKIADDEMYELLKKIKFDFNCNRNTYIKETLISNYLDNLFQTLDNIEEYFNKAKKETLEYIDNFINVPSPKTTLTNVDNFESIKCMINTNVKGYENENFNKEVKSFKTSDIVNVIEYKNDNNYAKIKTSDGNILYVDKNSVSIV